MAHHKRPNIILVLVDDLGFSDIDCYGSEIHTPNLRRIAGEGVRFTQMYNCARCCPTRASLLTGLYPHQAGVGHMVKNLGEPGYQGYLRDDCLTIAEVLKSAGYKTGMVGKWHVGGIYSALNEEEWTPGTPDHPLPTQRGFDSYYGTLEGCGSYFNPHALMEGENFIHIPPEIKDYYYTDDLSDHAVEFINRSAKSRPEASGGATRSPEASGSPAHGTKTNGGPDQDRPFFLYLSYTAPHWPLHAPRETIEKYRGRYGRGRNIYRMERYERLLKAGIMEKSWPLSPQEATAPAWADVPNKEWEDMRMAVYAAQVDRMDRGIGKVLGALEENGIGDDTLVMFVSDNGGCSEFLHENGWIENYVYPTRDGRPVIPGNDPERMPGGEDTFMSYDKPWTNVSNAPFRLYKRWVHEGGIATPFIVRWPNGINTDDTGEILPHVLHVVDIMATCVDAAGASYPEQRNGKKIPRMEGESILPLFDNDSFGSGGVSGNAESSLDRDEKRETPVFWEHEGNEAVRLGDWKLVREYDKPWELYNMENDRTELNDLAETEKAREKKMEKMYLEWAERCEVKPWSEILPKLRG